MSRRELENAVHDIRSHLKLFEDCVARYEDPAMNWEIIQDSVSYDDPTYIAKNFNLFEDLYAVWDKHPSTRLMGELTPTTLSELLDNIQLKETE